MGLLWVLETLRITKECLKCTWLHEAVVLKFLQIALVISSTDDLLLASRSCDVIICEGLKILTH